MKDSTRLNASNRKDIKQGLMKQRFSKEIDAISQERAAIALTVYERSFTQEDRNLMNSLPDGWLHSRDGIGVQAGEQSHHFGFNGAMYWRGSCSWWFYTQLGTVDEISKRMPYRYNKLQLKFTDALCERIRAVELQQSRLKEKMDIAAKQVDTMLKSYTTFGALKAAWPEVEPYLPKSEKPVAAVVKPPAVLPSTLNFLLDLPA